MIEEAQAVRLVPPPDRLLDLARPPVGPSLCLVWSSGIRDAQMHQLTEPADEPAGALVYFPRSAWHESWITRIAFAYFASVVVGKVFELLSASSSTLPAEIVGRCVGAPAPAAHD